MKKTVIFEAGINKVSSLADGSLSINLHTQELGDDTMTRIFALRKKPGMCLLSTDDKISKEELDVVENFTTDYEFATKSQSQRLRAVLYKVWEQGDQSLDFRIFYENAMDRIINKYKEVLE